MIFRDCTPLKTGMGNETAGYSLQPMVRICVYEQVVIGILLQPVDRDAWIMEISR